MSCRKCVSMHGGLSLSLFSLFTCYQSVFLQTRLSSCCFLQYSLRTEVTWKAFWSWYQSCIFSFETLCLLKAHMRSRKKEKDYFCILIHRNASVHFPFRLTLIKVKPHRCQCCEYFLCLLMEAFMQRELFLSGVTILLLFCDTGQYSSFCMVLSFHLLIMRHKAATVFTAIQ